MSDTIKGMADDSTPAPPPGDFQQTMSSMMHAVASEDYDSVIRLFFEGDALLSAQAAQQPQLGPQLETMRLQLRQMAERAWNEMLRQRQQDLERLIGQADALAGEFQLDGAQLILSQIQETVTMLATQMEGVPGQARALQEASARAESTLHDLRMQALQEIDEQQRHLLVEQAAVAASELSQQISEHAQVAQDAALKELAAVQEQLGGLSKQALDAASQLSSRSERSAELAGELKGLLDGAGEHVQTLSGASQLVDNLSQLVVHGQVLSELDERAKESITQLTQRLEEHAESHDQLKTYAHSVLEAAQLAETVNAQISEQIQAFSQLTTGTVEEIERSRQQSTEQSEQAAADADKAYKQIEEASRILGEHAQTAQQAAASAQESIDKLEAINQSLTRAERQLAEGKNLHAAMQEAVEGAVNTAGEIDEKLALVEQRLDEWRDEAGQITARNIGEITHVHEQANRTLEAAMHSLAAAVSDAIERANESQQGIDERISQLQVSIAEVNEHIANAAELAVLQTRDELQLQADQTQELAAKLQQEALAALEAAADIQTGQVRAVQAEAAAQLREIVGKADDARTLEAQQREEDMQSIETARQEMAAALDEVQQLSQSQLQARDESVAAAQSAAQSLEAAQASAEQAQQQLTTQQDATQAATDALEHTKQLAGEAHANLQRIEQIADTSAKVDKRVAKAAKAAQELDDHSLARADAVKALLESAETSELMTQAVALKAELDQRANTLALIYRKPWIMLAAGFAAGAVAAAGAALAGQLL